MAYKAPVPDHRKKWDVAQFEEKAKERLQAEKEERDNELEKARGAGRPPRDAPRIRREDLKPRTYTVRKRLN